MKLESIMALQCPTAVSRLDLHVNEEVPCIGTREHLTNVRLGVFHDLSAVIWEILSHVQMHRIQKYGLRKHIQYAGVTEGPRRRGNVSPGLLPTTALTSIVDPRQRMTLRKKWMLLSIT